MASSTKTSERTGFEFSAESLTRVHWVAALLAVVTGTVHLYLYVSQGFVGFLVAAVVFYAAIVALTLNVYRRVLYALGVPFTAGQIVLWYVAGMPEFALGVFDKVVQVLLIVVLLYLFVNERRLVDSTEST